MSESVCACALTDRMVRNKKAKEEGEAICVSRSHMQACMGVPCSACVNSRVCMSDEMAVVKGDRAGLCK